MDNQETGDVGEVQGEAAGQKVMARLLEDEMRESFIDYSMSVIVQRALPDVRDGLKPVHRRILYAMRELRLNPDQGYKKAARVVGDTMGQYHPHGDQSIYDALVRLAQDFAQRYPLVDGQGNFGNIDGDSAAAMRYTEARMTSVAMALLEGIDEDTVDFRQTYDGESEEPVVLPAAFPNLLANGAQGIAVGMATSIPPHNVGEVCDALLHLIKHPKARIDKLVELIPGPDFPTGGELVDERATIVEAYKTGRGAFRLRARWEVEKIKGGGYQIVVTEMPYQVQKSRLVEKIAELMDARKLILLGDVHDESTADVRLVLTPKSRNVEPEVLPGAFPNLLANGASGIAVGMATSIPPHNLDEICQALAHLIKYPKATIDKLLSFMPGPDFPTGGVLVETAENIRSAYRTGRGSFRLRARWEVEKLTRGQWQVVVTEIPYQIQKSRLVEKIAEQMLARKLPAGSSGSGRGFR